jgi:hypothetical protein
MMRIVLLLISMCPLVLAGEMEHYRAQKYAAYKAHTIMPSSLKTLIRKNGKELFIGLERGMAESPAHIDDRRLFAETEKITAMVDRHASFKDVVRQMGFVAGLVAVYSDPSRNSNRSVREGFAYYLNLKLDRCLFVFDGHLDTDASAAWIRNQLGQMAALQDQNRLLLENRYEKVGGNSRYQFSERSAVFGVTSIYFSNVARLSAHLWYHAWVSAHGDQTLTPFKKTPPPPAKP